MLDIFALAAQELLECARAISLPGEAKLNCISERSRLRLRFISTTLTIALHLFPIFLILRDPESTVLIHGQHLVNGFVSSSPTSVPPCLHTDDYFRYNYSRRPFRGTVPTPDVKSRGLLDVADDGKRFLEDTSW